MCTNACSEYWLAIAFQPFAEDEEQLARIIGGLAGGPPALAAQNPLQRPLATVWVELSKENTASGEAQEATTMAAPSAHGPCTAQQPPFVPVATCVGEISSSGAQFPGRVSSSSTSAPVPHSCASPHVAQRFSKVSVLLDSVATGGRTTDIGAAATRVKNEVDSISVVDGYTL